MKNIEKKRQAIKVGFKRNAIKFEKIAAEYRDISAQADEMNDEEINEFYKIMQLQNFAENFIKRTKAMFANADKEDSEQE